LPKDGHVIAQVLRGQVRFFAMGRDGKLKVNVVPSSDSSWSLSGHALHTVVDGKSAMGKDTVIDILQGLNESLYTKHSRSCNILKKQSYTRAGMLADLEELQGTFQVANSEVEQFFLKDGLTESDLTQLAEGKEFGKRTGPEDKVFASPNVLFPVIGTHPQTYGKHLGSANNGRLRFALVALNHREVLNVGFLKKFVARVGSLNFIQGLLSKAVELQHCPHEKSIDGVVFSASCLKAVESKHNGVMAALLAVDGNIQDSALATCVKGVGKMLGSLVLVNLFLVNLLLHVTFPQCPFDKKAPSYPSATTGAPPHVALLRSMTSPLSGNPRHVLPATITASLSHDFRALRDIGL